MNKVSSKKGAFCERTNLAVRQRRTLPILCDQPSRMS
jgi:hypothetical protein